MSDQSLREYLALLEARRAALNIQIAGVRADLGLEPEDQSVAVTVPVGHGGSLRGPNGAPRDVVAGRIRSDEFFKMSVPEAIQRYLEIMKQPQPPKAITEGLKAGGILSDAKHFYANVFTALKRLRAQGLVTNNKKGAWALASWYEGRSGAGQGKPEKKSKRRSKGKGKRPKARKPAAAASPPKPKGKYQAFIAEQMRAGKNMKEAASEWRKQQAGTGS